MTDEYPSWVDERMPFRGPCAFCGGPDARHREIDAILGCIAAGDGVEAVAADYEHPVAFVRRLMTLEPCQPRSEMPEADKDDWKRAERMTTLRRELAAGSLVAVSGGAVLPIHADELTAFMAEVGKRSENLGEPHIVIAFGVRGDGENYAAISATWTQRESAVEPDARLKE